MKYLFTIACILIFSVSSFAKNLSYYFGKEIGNYFIFSENEKELVLDWKGRVIIGPKYENISRINDNLWKVSININRKENNYTGYICPKDELDSNWRYKFLDNKGDDISVGWCEKIEDFSDGLAAVRQNGKWGFLNEKGGLKIGFIYEDANRFINGVAAVKLNGKWGYINKNGKVIIPIIYDDNGGNFFMSDYNAMKKGDVTIIVDKKGKEILILEKTIEVDTDHGFISRHYLRVEKDGKCSVSDLRTGKLEKFAYDYIDLMFSDGLLRFQNNGKFGYLDESLNVKIPPKYFAMEFRGGLAKVEINGKWGFMDKKERLVIEPMFDRISGKGFRENSVFVDGLALAAIGEKIGVIDRKGKFVIQPEYSHIHINPYTNIIYIEDFEKSTTGLADKKGRTILELGKYSVGCCVYANGRIRISVRNGKPEQQNVFEDEDKTTKSGYVDFSGKILIKPIYDAVYFYRNGLAAAKSNGKWGFIDKSEKTVIDYKFDAVAGNGFNEKGTAAVKAGNKWGIINKSGVFIVSPKYEDDIMNSFTSVADFDSSDY